MVSKSHFNLEIDEKALIELLKIAILLFLAHGLLGLVNSLILLPLFASENGGLIFAYIIIGFAVTFAVHFSLIYWGIGRILRDHPKENKWVLGLLTNGIAVGIEMIMMFIVYGEFRGFGGGLNKIIATIAACYFIKEGNRHK